MHSIEAVIATLLFLVFIITVLPRVTTGESEQETVQRQAQNVLSSLDTAGELRPPVVERNVSALQDRIASRLSPHPVEISLLTMNATGDRVRFTGTHSRAFQVNDSIAERERLRVWYRDAAAPNVSVGAVSIANHTGTVTDTYEDYDIADATVDGDNTLEIDVDGSSLVAYSIEITNRRRTGTAPTDTDTFSIPYMVAGANTTFLPAEVTVITWR